jgi:hypothetical protein
MKRWMLIMLAVVWLAAVPAQAQDVNASTEARTAGGHRQPSGSGRVVYGQLTGIPRRTSWDSMDNGEEDK